MSGAIETTVPDRGTDEHAETSLSRRRRLRRVLKLLGLLGVVLALLMGGGLWFLTDRYAGNVDRVSDVLATLDEGARPMPATPAQQAGEEPVTFPLVGSDTRATTEEGIAAGGRSDAIMIARFSADRQHARLISIPRDSWVTIPGRGTGKVNAAYAYGGPTLLIQTVEQLTDVRIDHYVAIDFEGLVQVTDDLGGVTSSLQRPPATGRTPLPQASTTSTATRRAGTSVSATDSPVATSTACAGSSSTCRRCSARCSAPTPSATRAGWTPRCWP
jgi:anionic cell wall polymer biosynthesis LytR-Cps2A-Psr (LCP) family protein